MPSKWYNESAMRNFEDLLRRSKDKEIYTYTVFLNPSQIAEAERAAGNYPVSFYGGCDFAERKMARFGSEETVGYAEEFPVGAVKITVSGIKFSQDGFTHRDVLGAALALGIERDRIGDIFVGKTEAYLVAEEKIADFLVKELRSVGRFRAAAEKCDRIPEEFAPKTEEKTFTVQSDRVDAVLCKIYNLSRENGSKLVSDGRVFIDGKECVKDSRPLRAGETVSVRGLGKFVFSGEGGLSKKGKTYVKVTVYI